MPKNGKIYVQAEILCFSCFTNLECIGPKPKTNSNSFLRHCVGLGHMKSTLILHCCRRFYETNLNNIIEGKRKIVHRYSNNTYRIVHMPTENKQLINKTMKPSLPKTING